MERFSLPTCEGGLQDFKGKPQVTTFVTANPDDDNADDLDRLYPFPANAITVSRNLVRAVDDIGRDKPRSETSTNDEPHTTRSGSEDGLFGKC
jgi:hypothetical protein